MHVHRIETGPWRQNCYVVHQNNETAVLIDPGDDHQIIIDYLTDSGTKVLAILNTHGHVDHIGAVEAIRTRYSVPFFLHSSDWPLVKSANTYAFVFGRNRPIEIPCVDEWSDTYPNGIVLGDSKYEVILTPGHTPGGVCYLINNCLFSGDTAFPTQAGRTDLPGGDAIELRQSIVRLCELDEEIIIFPGHGRSTTVAEILANDILSTVSLE